MRLRWIFLLLAMPLTHGCVTSFPQETDITGTWEGVSLAYVLFEYDSPANRHIVMGSIDEDDDEERFEVGELSNFLSREKDFTLLVTANIDGEITTEVMRGEVYGSRLLLHFMEEESEDDEISVWLIKSNDFDSSRMAARNSLNKFLDAKK